MTTDFKPHWVGLYEDPITHAYPLGNGYRTYVPTLMRFMAPDESSPFDEGGINPYAYCAADPINRLDPSGHFFLPIGLALGALGAIGIKAAGSALVSKFRGPVRAWIDSLRGERNMGAYEAEHASPASSSFGRAHAGESGYEFAKTPMPRKPARDLHDAGANSIGMSDRDAARMRKNDGTAADRLNLVENDLATVQMHREKVRLLRLGAEKSHDPQLLSEIILEERADAFSVLDSIHKRLKMVESFSEYLEHERKHELRLIRAKYERLQRNFDNRFL